MDAHDHDGGDAALETALEQELRGGRPPDLTERVLAAARRPAPSRVEHARQRWLAAALVVLALGLVVLVWAWSHDGDGLRDARSDDVLDPLPWHRDLVVPESVSDADRLIGDRSEVTARAFAVRDPATGRLVAVSDNPWENLLAPLFGQEKFEPRAGGDRFQESAWTSFVHDVLQRYRPASAAPFATLPLELLFEIPDRGTLVVGVDDTVDPVRVQVRGLPLVWEIPRDHALPQSLRQALAEPLRRAIEDRGLALGRAALDALPADTTRIRAWSLQPDDLATLPRFAGLTTLDLSGSPDAVTPASLAHLARCPKLRSLVLPADGIGAAHLEPVVALPELAELFVGPLAWDLMFRKWPEATNSIDDRCAALFTRASKLGELSLPFTQLTDDGLAKLSVLPLRTLLVGSSHITGAGFAAFASSTTLRSVSLRGCDALTAAGLGALAAGASGVRADAGQPAVQEIVLCECPLPDGGLGALLDGIRLRELGLLRCRPASSWPRVLEEIARSRAPERLSLSIDGDLRLDDLVHLTGAERLQGIEASVPRDRPLRAEVLERIRAALPGVSLDAWRPPG